MALFSRTDRTFHLELERRGSELVERVHVGDAAEQCSDLGTAEAAFEAYRQRFVELLQQGWNLAVGDADLTRTVACDPELEARIGDGDDRAVYADWLIEHGDPCGELASLRARAEQATTPMLEYAITMLERTRKDELFGLLAALPSVDIKFGWTRGWVSSIRIDTANATVVALALLAPIARFVSAIEMRRFSTERVCSAIATSPRRDRIRRLVMVERHYVQSMLDALPRLEQLQMWSGSTTKRGHPNVRFLSLSVDGRRNVEPLAGAWPALEELTVAGEHDVSRWLTRLARLPYLRGLRALHIDAPVEPAIVRDLMLAFPGLHIADEG